MNTPAGVAALLVCLALPAWSASTLSADRHYVVAGFGDGQNLELVQWAVRVEAQLEEALDLTIPFLPADPMRIVARFPADGDAPVGRVEITVPGADPRRGQRLEVIHPASVTEEALLEQLTAALLQRVAGRAEGVPGWFAAGVAQHLVPGLRERNRRVMATLDFDGLSPRPTDLLGRGRGALPAEALWQRALAGLFVGWLTDRAGEIPGGLHGLVRRLSSPAAVTPHDLVDWVGGSSMDGFRRSWDVWLAAQQRVTGPGRGDAATGWRRLEALGSDPGWAVLRGADPAPAWWRRVCRGRIRLQMHRLCLPAPPGLVAWCERVDATLAAMETPRADRAWNEFQAGLAEALAARRARSRRLDLLEAQLDSSGPAGTLSPQLETRP